MDIYSLAFPNMLSSGKVNLYKNSEATMSNLKLILQSELTSLFGDPGYGCSLYKILYSPNNVLIQDVIIDEIYTCIQLYMPQIIVQRNDIQITADDLDIYAKIRATSAVDYTLNLYSINLTNTEENRSEL